MQLDTRKKFLEKAKKQIKKGIGKDILAIQTIRCIDDTDKVKSLLYSRMLEWARLNFPEISGNDDAIINLFAEFGCKEDFEFDKLQEILGEKQALKILERKENSFGTDFSLQDKKALQTLASTIREISKLKSESEDYLEKTIREIMPNVFVLAGANLAGRFLALAGSLENLAEMPSSTIQVIGAERSLFKHLRSHTLPPKHGIIFMHPAVNAAPESKRGKIARALAAKISIAAKADYYTKRDIVEKLKNDFEKRLKQIHEAPEKKKHHWKPPLKRPYYKR
ncbi:MAG: hypothetical protein ABH803_03690 [Candidatus Micrarchaeota archaeon]